MPRELKKNNYFSSKDLRTMEEVKGTLTNIFNANIAMNRASAELRNVIVDLEEIINSQ